MSGKSKYSHWEIDEILYYLRHGWTRQQVAWYFRTSTKTISRLVGGVGKDETLRMDSAPADVV